MVDVDRCVPERRTESSGEYAYKISSKGLDEWKTSLDKDKCVSEIIPEKNRLTFSWCNINVYTKKIDAGKKDKSLSKNNIKKKQILKNVTGIAHPGELLLIMGSSGAGKTTLLNCLTFRNLKDLTVSGLVCINDVAVDQTELAARSAYIQQDDLFIKSLTVKEHLIFQALVRMDPFLEYREKLDRVERVMIELSLKKCENIQIGLPGVIKGISGGERKRLAVASELLTNPSLLICDEPTTGLDSFMSLNVVQMLKDMAATGRTVITTLHQPSSELFHMFDKLCLIADGRTAFIGSLAEASTFFAKIQLPCPQNFNPADHYIQTLSLVPGKEENCRKIANKICNAFAETTDTGREMKKIAEKNKVSEDMPEKWSNKKGAINPYRVGWWAQMRAILWRSWLTIIKDPDMTVAPIYVALLESLIFAVIYFGQTLTQLGIKNIDGVLFFFLTASSFQNVLAVIATFCEELPLFMKEHRDGMYRTDTYYLAKILCDFPFSALMMVSKIALCYYFIGLNPEISRFLTALFISMLLGQAARGGGFLISTLAPNVHIASVLVSFVVMPLVIFGGFYLSISSVPSFLRWLANLSWFRYAYIAFMVNQWSDINHIPCNTTTIASSVCMYDGLEVLQNRSISIDEFWPAIVSLILLILFFRIVSFLALLYKACRKE